MGESRNVYREVEDRRVIRTADVYQTEMENGTEGYSDTLLSVVANFKNSGAPEGFNCQCMVGKSKRGEVAMRLFAVVEERMDGEGGACPPGGPADFARLRFARAGFKTRGCLAMTAAASVVCDMVEGKTFEEALAITADDVKAALDGVPWDKLHTVYFAACGVRALAGDYLARCGMPLASLDEQLPCDEFGISCTLAEHCSLRNTRIELKLAEG